MVSVDISGMVPASHGVERGAWTSQPSFIGGRKDGQSCSPGWHGLLRDEVGCNLDEAAQLPAGYYVLHKSTSTGGLWLYIHSSLIPDPPACA